MKVVILVIMLYLVSVCSAEPRIWTAINGNEVEAEFVSKEKGIVKLKLKSGKFFEVPANKLSKEDNEFLSSLAKPDGVNGEELEERIGGFYLKDSDVPYTGKVFRLYKNGQKQFESNLKNGKTDGLIRSWYENGEPESESNWNNGILNGLQITWHKNGQKKSEGKIKEGKEDGMLMEWYENGQKKSEENWKDGKPNGAMVLWKRGGQKIREQNYKDGKEDGLQTTWHLNGQKSWEADYKDGKVIAEMIWNTKGEPVRSWEEALEEKNTIKTNLKYEIKDDMVTITDCDANASGAEVIPATIEGKPVITISKSAFADCIKLTSIKIPNSVTSIEDGAFRNCTSLKKINIPDSVTSIQDNTFRNCTSLSSIYIPNSITKIGNSAFRNCASLRKLYIPDSVISISVLALSICSSLKSVTFLGDAPKESYGVFLKTGLIIYRKPKAMGWGETWGQRPVKLIVE